MRVSNSIFYIVLLLSGCQTTPARLDVSFYPVENDTVKEVVIKGNKNARIVSDDCIIMVSLNADSRFYNAHLFVKNTSGAVLKFRTSGVSLFFQDKKQQLKELKKYVVDEYLGNRFGYNNSNPEWVEVETSVRELYLTDHDITPDALHSGMIGFDYKDEDFVCLRVYINSDEHLIIFGKETEPLSK